MARALLLLALCALFVGVAHCEIVELTSETFLSDVVGSDDSWFVMLYVAAAAAAAAAGLC